MLENNSENKGQRRIIRHFAFIDSETGQVSIPSEQITEIAPNGDIITTEVTYSLIMDGEKISSTDDIAGKCQRHGCNRHVTARSFRSCFYCGKIICPRCAKWDEKTNRWLCIECRRKLRAKRIIIGFLKILAFPFRRRHAK